MRTQNNLVSEYDLLIAGCEQEREARAFSLGPSLHKNQAENHLFSTKIEFLRHFARFWKSKVENPLCRFDTSQCFSRISEQIVGIKLRQTMSIRTTDCQTRRPFKWVKSILVRLLHDHAE